uniref:Uncharacterized protein n=1 Tax=Lepeophtheirus salmonis TaxID=72036 RepID=A0A0K2ULJ7_LEPSM
MLLDVDFHPCRHKHQGGLFCLFSFWKYCGAQGTRSSSRMELIYSLMLIFARASTNT